MPPPDPPERPKPTMPAAAREAMLAREAAAKAKAAAGVPKPAVAKAAPLPPASIEPPKPQMAVGLAGFAVWLLAAVAALSLLYNFKVAKDYQALVLPRKIAGGVLGGLLLLAIWFQQALEKDARLVRLVWAVALLALVLAPVLILIARPH